MVERNSTRRFVYIKIKYQVRDLTNAQMGRDGEMMAYKKIQSVVWDTTFPSYISLNQQIIEELRW